MKWQRLPREFFLRDAEIAAEELVGKLLVRQTESEMHFLRITETEVYKGETDTACHASRGKTKRNAPLYEAGGRYYLYLCYGIHWLMNVVTGKEGEPQGVLIRACEGAEGPGKLTKALGIDGLFRESDAEDETLYFVSDGAAPSICRKKRVGIGYASKEDQDRLWRFVACEKRRENL